MEPTSEPLVMKQKKRRREDEIMDECKKAGVFPACSDNSSSLNSSTSYSLSSLRITLHFEALPLDILLYILSFIPHKQLLRLTYTSKRCKEVIGNSVLWNTIKLDDSGSITGGNNKKNIEDLLPFECFQRINKKLLSQVRELYLVESTCRKVADGHQWGQFSRSLMWICKNCTALQKLQLDWCGSLLNSDIVSLTQENLHLLHLSMNFNPILVSDTGITLLARLGLERLDLSLFKNITERGLREFLAKCKSVRRITVDTCGCIDDESLDNLKKLFPNVKITVTVDDDDEEGFIPPIPPGPYLPSDDSDIPSSPSDVDSDNYFYNDSDDDGGDSDSSGGHFRAKDPKPGPRTNGKVATQNGHASTDNEDNDEEFTPSEEEEEEGSSEGEPENAQSEASDDEDTEKEEELQH